MLHLIDGIVPQTDIQPGDILIFDNGKPRCSLSSLMSLHLQYGQALFYTSPYRSSYLHAGLCSAKDSKQRIDFHHLHYTSMTGGYNTKDQHDLKNKPFHRPMLILRPKSPELAAALIQSVEQIKDNQVHIDKNHYISDLWQPRNTPPNQEALAATNTCIGFITNILQNAYKKIGKIFHLNQSASTTEVLAYTLQQRDEFSILLAPSKNPQKLLSLIISFVECEVDRLKQVYFFRSSALDKAITIQTIANAHPTSKNSLEDLQTLLAQLKPEMQKARILWPSTSFTYLIDQIEAQGVYSEYITQAPK